VIGSLLIIVSMILSLPTGYTIVVIASLVGVLSAWCWGIMSRNSLFFLKNRQEESWALAQLFNS